MSVNCNGSVRSTLICIYITRQKADLLQSLDGNKNCKINVHDIDEFNYSNSLFIK